MLTLTFSLCVQSGNFHQWVTDTAFTIALQIEMALQIQKPTSKEDA